MNVNQSIFHNLYICMCIVYSIYFIYLFTHYIFLKNSEQNKFYCAYLLLTCCYVSDVRTNNK